MDNANNVGGTNIRDSANQADHILARLKRDDPMTALAVIARVFGSIVAMSVATDTLIPQSP